MSIALNSREKAMAENNDKLWEVLSLYVDDPEGVTRYEAIELADFNMAEGGPEDRIFTRAIKVCKTRAKKAGMLIPRATPVKGRGYVYLLAKSGKFALEGYMAQERVSSGVRKSAATHEKFIDQDRESLPPVLRAVFDELVIANTKYDQYVEESVNTQRQQLESVYSAYVEEQGQPSST